jgi:hypothetical protein
MSIPISPPVVRGSPANQLPAYLSNGVVGLRVRDVPFVPGMTLLSGFSGEHPVRRIEAGAVAPYPCAADLQLNGVWLADAPHQVETVDQAYDFACGELTTRFRFLAGDVTADVEVLTFCDRTDPTLVCQETKLAVNRACEVALRASIDGAGVDGRVLRTLRDTPGESEPACDGAVLWESPGGVSTCGLAYVTELLGAGEAKPSLPPLSGFRLTSEYRFSAHAGQTYRLRQMISLIPRQMHDQPDFQAVRLVAMAAKRGFQTVQECNRREWEELWKSRIRLVGAKPRWQEMADAAFFYLVSSTHKGSPASTSIFGLATWHDYHYYYSHVMWDIETFAAPVLNLINPGAAAAILDYRFRNLRSAAANARIRGRRGLQFPWESSPSRGEECAPMPGNASWHEDHVSLDVALAFATHAHVTGDARFFKEKAWPVLAGVAEWIESRVAKTERGYEIQHAMGIAERETESNNAAFTNMSAVLVLREAAAAAARVGLSAPVRWLEIADGMVLPMRDKLLVSHDGFRVTEEKGATPDPLMGVFPLGFPLDEKTRDETLRFYLKHASEYLGSPMLSALFGVWAARAGDRELSLRLMEEGYAKFCTGRFGQTLEYRDDVFPEQPRAGPFFANLAGFLGGLLWGFTGLRPTEDGPESWSRYRVVLPSGWEAIEVGRLWIHGREASLRANNGAERAVLTFK